MKIQHPQAKGKRLEYEFRDMIRDAGLDDHAQRSPMSGAIAMIPSDIVSKVRFSFECKSYARHSIYKFWDQAVRGASARKPAALVLKANNRNILVAIDGDDFLTLYAYAKKGGYEEDA